MRRAMTLAAALVFVGVASAQQLKVTGRAYVAASGQWKSDGDMGKVEEAGAKVKIECDKNIALCAVAEGTNLLGSGNLFTRLDVTPVHYTILRWDNDGLVAQTLVKDCVTDRLVIDFRAKSVTMIETPKSGREENEACRTFSKIVTSRLVNAGRDDKKEVSQNSQK
jgi:hypothetical protein